MDQKLLSTFDEETKKNILSYIEGDYEKAVKDEITNLLKNDPEEVKNAFYAKMSFGTGGIRGKMGIGTNRLSKYTIRSATQGLASYLKKEVKEKALSVLIGYDNRKNSRIFAEQTAGVLAENGIKALLFKTLCPTPIVSYGCRLKKCNAAVMITASHNPPEYNGYKVYWKDGGQVLPPHDTGIINEVDAISDPSKIKVAPLSHPLIEMIGEEIFASYLKKIEELKSNDKENKKQGKNLQVIYTSLHGTGITVIPHALSNWGFTNLVLVKEQCQVDENFSFAKKPNPEEKSTLEMGIKLLLEKKGDILLATDPDADRLATVVSHKGSFVILSGNQIGSILLEHILSSLKQSGKLKKSDMIVKSIVTTNLLSEIAKGYGVNCLDVLTGFKYISEKIELWKETGKYNFLFGAEESLGFLRGDFVRDKDSISAACLFCEAALKVKLKGRTLVDMLYSIYKKYGVYREGLISLGFEDGAKGIEKMKKIMQDLRSSPPKVIASYGVDLIEDYKTKKKLFLDSKRVEAIDLPSSDILTFILDDSSSIVIRPSGTEPKIKIYLSVTEKSFKEVEEGIKLGDERLAALSSAVKELIGI